MDAETYSLWRTKVRPVIQGWKSASTELAFWYVWTEYDLKEHANRLEHSETVVNGRAFAEVTPGTTSTESIPVMILGMVWGKNIVL